MNSKLAQICRTQSRTHSTSSEYILFRDVEHFGISSALGINPIQFRKLDHTFHQQPEPIQTEFRIIPDTLPIPELLPIPGIPSHSIRFRNSVPHSLFTLILTHDALYYGHFMRLGNNSATELRELSRVGISRNF